MKWNKVRHLRLSLGNLARVLSLILKPLLATNCDHLWNSHDIHGETCDAAGIGCGNSLHFELFADKYVSMTDVTQPSSGCENVPLTKKRPEGPGKTPAGEDLLSFAELLFFAYRDFTSEPDEILADYGFGRAHHRVLHFVNRNPGLRVAQLLNILKIKKQSLSRVLKQLIDESYITQQTGPSDGRERLLYVTPKGAELAQKLADLQVARIKSALEGADVNSNTSIRRFLYSMISKDEQHQVAKLVPSLVDLVSFKE